MRKSALSVFVLAVLLICLTVPVAGGKAEASGSYSEDFSDGLAQGWTTSGGTWSIVSNNYYKQADFDEYTKSVYGGSTWDTDYTYSAKVYTASSTGNRDGLIYNYVDASNYYYLLINAYGDAELHKVIGGTDTQIDTGTFTGGGVQVWNTVEIGRSGDDTTIKVNGGTVFQATQTELGAGKIGLINHWMAGRFDDIVVSDNGGDGYKNTYPKIGGMYIGGPRQYENSTVQQNLAKHDLVILGFWKGWSHSGKTIQQTVQEIKGYNPDMLVGQYTILESAGTNPSDTATTDIYNKLGSEDGPNGVGDWWARDASGNLVSHYSGSATTNITDFVEPDANGDHYTQWLAKRNDGVFFDPVPEFDIWYSDNAFYKPRTDNDWDGDGVDDSKNSATVQQYFREGMVDYWNEIETLEPNLLIMGNVDGDAAGHGWLNETEYKNKLPGAFFESAIGQSWSMETQYGWETMMDAYRDMMDNTTSPHLVVFNAKGEADDYAQMRYGLASTLMENGYYSYNSLSGSYSDAAINWYDEYDVDLGQAVDGPQRSPWSNGVYKREFENGLVLVNPKGNGTQTVSIGSGYKHFSGTQDPTVNNGAAVTSVMLNERDGVILIKQ